MTRIISLLILFILPVGELHCQIIITDTLSRSFNRIYLADTVAIGAQGVMPVTDGYYIQGRLMATAYDLRAAYLRKINLIGETQWVRIYESDEPAIHYTETGSMLDTLSNGDLIYGYTFEHLDGSGEGDFSIMRLNREGDIIWKHDHYGPIRESLRALLPTSNDDVIYAGWIQAEDNNTKVLTGRVDSSGTLLWQKTVAVADTMVRQVALSLCHGIDGGFLLTGTYGNFFAGPDRGSLLVKCSDDGAVEWHRQFDQLGSDASGLYTRPYGDSSYVTTAVIDPNVLWPLGHSGYLGEINLAGQTVRDTLLQASFDVSPIGGLVINEDQSLTMAMGVGVNLQDGNAAAIWNLDSSFTITSKLVLSPDTMHQMVARDLHPTPDGGYIIVGFRGDALPQYAWAAKIDSAGNICDSLHHGCHDAILKTDTIFYPDAISIELENLECDVYPNPASDHLHISYDFSDLSAPVWFRLYNQYGIEMRSKQLQNHVARDEEVPLWHLSPGGYFYQLTAGSHILKSGQLFLSSNR